MSHDWNEVHSLPLEILDEQNPKTFASNDNGQLLYPPPSLCLIQSDNGRSKKLMLPVVLLVGNHDITS